MRVTAELITKYHLGSCTEAEKRAVEQWLGTGAGDVSCESGIDISSEEKIIWNKIDTGSNNALQPALRYISAIAAIVVAAFFIYHYSVGDNPKTTENHASTAGTNAWHVIRTTRGETDSVLLPDGTQVFLNAESKLSYSDAFATGTRSVRLSGEAYFRVKHDPAHPFTIQTTNTTVTVLGTHFDVKAYGDENNTSVVVEEGRVRFAAQNKALILSTNDRGIYTADGQMLQNNAYAAKYIRWKDHILEFDNETLISIARTLGRRYDAHINIDNAMLNKQRFTGRFDDVPLNEVLKQMSFVLKCHYSIKGNNTVIY